MLLHYLGKLKIQIYGEFKGGNNFRDTVYYTLYTRDDDDKNDEVYARCFLGDLGGVGEVP